MALPDIRFGPECDNFSVFSVLDLLNAGHRALEPGNGDVYLEFHLGNGTVLCGSYAGHDNHESAMIVELWDRERRTPTGVTTEIVLYDVERIAYP
jgi:hypothetical protein